MPSSATIDSLVKRLQTAQSLITSGKLSEAADRLNALRKSAPEDARVYVLGSRLAEAAGNAPGAQQAARHAVKLAPYWPPAVTELAFLLARQNQFDDAIEFARKAIELDGSNPEVLGRVIDVAHRARKLDLAVKWLGLAISIAPDNAHLKHLLATDLRDMGEHDKAIAIYDALIDQTPNDAIALVGRLQTRLAAGQSALAQQDGEALLALEPTNETFKYWQAQTRGETPGRQPLAIVRELYDGFADLYDQHVVAGLKYKLPREVARKIQALYPGNKLNVLDLGAGTGLLGACLGRIDGGMIGVELSPKMIEQAAKHGVYDRFHNVDLVEALQETPESLYDVIASLDVFIYVGDLGGVIPNAHRILVPGGHLIFSCETASEDESDMVLRPSGRYAHKPSHVEALCRAAGFADISVEAMALRMEAGKPIAGFLVTARKNA
ncbi:MAG: Methyltransferase type 12 [Ramlibacter sp.]|nr:Methyltransferase type 12 [Ramlibacter sp.]